MGIDRYFTVQYYEGLEDLIKSMVVTGRYMSWNEATMEVDEDEDTIFGMVIRAPPYDYHRLSFIPEKNMMTIGDLGRYTWGEDYGYKSIRDFYQGVTGAIFDMHSEYVDLDMLDPYPEHSSVIASRLERINMEPEAKHCARRDAKKNLVTEDEVKMLHTLVGKMEDANLATSALGLAKKIRAKATATVDALEQFLSHCTEPN